MVNQGKLLKILGTENLVGLFNDLGEEVQNKILQTSFKKAGQLILSEASSNLGGRYSTLRGSFGMSYKKSDQTLSVGAIRGSGGSLGHIVDSGTKERSYLTKNGVLHKTGRITGNNFWTRAVTSTSDDVEQTIYKEIKLNFEKIISKRNK